MEPETTPTPEELADMRKCFLMNEKRLAYNREYMKRYRVEHRAKVNEYKLKWYHLNKDKVKGKDTVDTNE